MKVNGHDFKVKFVLGLIVGDNLGINSVLGFSRSFSANYFCRFCLCDKKNSQVLSVENLSLLRTLQNYDENVSNGDYKNTGIYEESIFNKINNFHVINNYAVDIMHDLFEGVCMYNMNHIINHLIQLNFFNLETLNMRKKSFNYGKQKLEIYPPLLFKSNRTS